MNFNKMLSAGVVIPILCFANSPLPYAGQCRLLDKILAAVAAQPQTATIALELLERVALGRTPEINSEFEAQVGAVPGYLQNPEFKTPTVRAYAFWKIGETGLPDAVDFLAKLKPADIGIDTSQQIWPAAQIALRNARLKGIENPQAKVEFLKSTLTGPHDAISNSAVTTWAVNQLCDHGAHTASPEIQKSIRARMERQDGEDEIRFCEARIQVVFRNPDRVKALGSVLSVAGVTEEDRLVRWAIYQLGEMRSPDADAELKRFATEIGRLPDSSPQKRRLTAFKGEINSSLQHQ